VTKTFTLCVLCALCGSVVFAQNYQCNWSVIDQGGGMMSSTSFRAMPSVGQTAIGIITSTSFQGFIGFWQIDTAASGIREDEHWTVESPLVTRLFDPAPNPGPGNALIRYSLATETHVTLRLFDLAGRNVAVLINAVQRAGQYSVPLISHSAFRTPHLSSGVYFLKMSAGDYRATRKLIVQ